MVTILHVGSCITSGGSSPCSHGAKISSPLLPGSANSPCPQNPIDPSEEKPRQEPMPGLAAASTPCPSRVWL